jgi:hypothetical protein
MKNFVTLLASAAALVASTAGVRTDEALLKALSASKHSLAEGIQQVAKGNEVAISAKFELEDGKLSLSVYTAGKGLAVDAEHNALQEYAGSPEAAAWKPEVEVFKDVEHVARSAQQLTLMALSSSTLLDIAKKAEKDGGGKVYSITPTLRDRKAVFVALVADKEKSVELDYDLVTGASVKPIEAGAPKK